jgi:hypothetical protein
MSTRRPWLLYGTGTIAERILACAREAGLELVVVGRSAVATRDLGARFGCRALIADVDRLPRLLDEVPDVDAAAGVINATGPYGVVARALMDVAIARGIHYVDLSNEWQTHEQAWQLRPRVIEAGVGVVSGAGFGTYASEIAAHHLLALSSGPRALRVTLRRSGARSTTAGRASSQRVLAQPAVHRRDGRTLRRSDWLGVRAVRFGSDARFTVAPITDGNLHVLLRTLDIPNLEMSMTVPTTTLRSRMSLPGARRHARRAAQIPPAPPVSVSDNGPTIPMPPSPDPTVRPRSAVFATILDRDGTRRSVSVSTSKSLDFSAQVAIAATDALTDRPRSGVLSAFQLLGAAAFQELPDARLDDLR